MAGMVVAPDVWNTVVILVAFITARSLLTTMFDEWRAVGADDRRPPTWDSLFKDVVQTFFDTNWTTLLFIIVQWVIDMFKGFWLLTASPIVGVVAMEVPVLILTALLYSSYNSPFELSSSNKIADNMLASLNFSISYFVGNVLVTQLVVTPSLWDFLWVTIGFVALRAAVNQAFDEWPTRTDTAEAAGESALKAVLFDNVQTLISIGVFILTRLFVQIFQLWWLEGEHWIVAFVVFQTFLLVVLSVMAYLTEQAERKEDVPDAMVNRALFAMAMFIAEKARSQSSASFNEFHLIVLTVAFVGLHATTNAALDSWKPGEGADALGERVLKATIAKNVRTWITITVVFVVRLLVDLFAIWWQDEPNAIVGMVLIEVTCMLLITGVKTLMFFETRGLYKRTHSS
jgi:hypothetical protein